MLKRFFITVSLLIATSQFANADIRFIQVAESSYTINHTKHVEKCIEDINAIKDVDFVVFTGDNIAKARKENLKGFLKILRKCNKPIYLAFGDKDVSKEKGLNKETYREECFKYLGFGQSLKTNYVFKKNGYVFLVADGAKEFFPAPNGYYKEETIDWLNKQLTKYQKKNVIILQHFPLLESGTKEYNTYKAHLYKEMLEQHSNVVAIISGHFNTNIEEVHNGVTHIITPSYNSTMEYKIIDIVGDSNEIYSQLRHVE